LSEHLDIILTARALCESSYESAPNDSGMALLAAQFVDTDRVEYLEKA
jgi:ATP-dependent DNA helicase RecG